MLINKFKFRRDVQSYNLGGMGCSIGVVAIGLVRDMLQVSSGWQGVEKLSACWGLSASQLHSKVHSPQLHGYQPVLLELTACCCTAVLPRAGASVFYCCGTARSVGAADCIGARVHRDATQQKGCSRCHSLASLLLWP